MLKEENYIDIINNYSLEKWKPILELISKIEQEKSSVQIGGKIDSKLIHYNYSQTIRQFQSIAYDIPIIISFDWINWKEGKEILKKSNFDYNQIDIPSKCKVISAIIRSERFNNGTLLTSFEDGTIHKILKSIEEQLKI